MGELRKGFIFFSNKLSFIGNQAGRRCLRLINLLKRNIVRFFEFFCLIYLLLKVISNKEGIKNNPSRFTGCSSDVG